MNISRIDNTKDMVIVLKQSTNREKGIFEVKEALIGEFDLENGEFFDEINEVYYHHFSDYDEELEEEYFIGCIKVPIDILDKDKEKVLSDYIDKYKDYLFYIKNGIIVSENINNKRKAQYTDSIIELTNFLSRFRNNIMESAIKGVASIGFEIESFEDLEEPKQEQSDKEEIKIKETRKTDILKKTPHAITEEIKRYVKGQDEAIEKIITNIYEKLKYKNRDKSNMLLIGPTGVGKTYIFEIISRLFDIPLLVYSVPGLTQSGFRGKDIENILKQLILNCGGDIKKAENSIVILDEIDKIASKNNDEVGVATEAVQNELLKLIDGEKTLIELEHGHEVEIDTSRILFIGVGAFQELFNKNEEVPKRMGFGASQEQLKKSEEVKIDADTLFGYGLKREFAGRLPQKIKLNALTEEVLVDIIVNNKDGKMQKTINLLKECGVSITNVNEFASMIAKDAITKKIGARGITSTIDEIFQKIKYDIFNHPCEYEYLTIGQNILKDHNDYILTKKVKAKRKVKRVGN